MSLSRALVQDLPTTDPDKVAAMLKKLSMYREHMHGFVTEPCTMAEINKNVRTGLMLLHFSILKKASSQHAACSM